MPSHDIALLWWHTYVQCIIIDGPLHDSPEAPASSPSGVGAPNPVVWLEIQVRQGRALGTSKLAAKTDLCVWLYG